MKSYNIGKKNYYLADDLMMTYPSFFKGCKNSKSIITKKDRLPKNKYIFARKINDEWIESEGNSKKFDKLFIYKKWYDDNHSNDKEDNIVEAPNLIHLEDNEMFTDNDGNLIDIEVRGEREFDKCYFKVRDIMNGFGLKNLHKTITDKRHDGYIENIHYKYFYLEKVGDHENRKIKKLYLTYRGFMRILFSSNKNTAEKFVKWALETLFIAQMGNEIQKHQLVANLIGVSTDAVKSVFNKTACKIPSIYLFYIGEVKFLREFLNISNIYDDDDYVCKWGMTLDLERRTKEHEKTYGKLKNANLKLLLFGYIDPQYISEAETKIKHLFENMDFKLDHDKYNEIAIVPKNKMKIIKEQYEMISKVYMGHAAELINKIREKESEILLLKEKHEKEIQKKENDLLRKDNELLHKDLEITQYKLKHKK